MSQTKRAWKLHEFVAHGAAVNCLAMGKKSGRVMVSGGEDRKVNLWPVDKPNCVMSLTGHTTPVEAVRFGHNEEMVVAGSMSGALKIWDLEAAKILRTLTGHKSSIRSLDFHPYGDYAASGSLDCNVKLWDIRRKGCIYTYKGHTNCVNCIRFSPDGRWIGSAGEDGLVRLWDLTAGKALADLRQHTAGVNILEFHPNEMLIASGSSDRTIKFWDLERFELVSSTDGDSTPIRCIFFHPDESCLFSGSKDLLKVYSWEPAACYDSIPMAWGEVSDIAIAHNQLIGCSFSQTNVSTYVVDLQKIQPFGGVPNQEGNNQPMTSSRGRKSFVTDRPPTQSSRQASIPKEDASEPTSTSPDEDRESAADIKDPDDYNKIFHPNRRLARSPTRNQEPFQPPSDDVITNQMAAVHISADQEPVRQPAPTKKTKPGKPSVPAATRTREIPPAQKPADPPTRDQPASREPAPVKPQPKVSQPVQPPPKQSSPAQPPGINAQDFLPKAAPGLNNQVGDQRLMPEEDVLDIMDKGHGAMVTVMANRSKNLQIVRAMWTSGNTKTAVDSAISMSDQAVIVDVLNVLNLKQGLWNLDLCTSLLPHLKDLINSKYETYVITACSSLKIILKNFGPVIKANLTSPPSFGVDISREERHRKCNSCYGQLMGIRTVVDKKQNVTGKVGDTFKQLQILLGTLDS